MSLAEETEAGSSPASRLLELIDERMPAERAAPIRAFAQAYLRRLSADASEGVSPEDLLGEIVSLFDFASSRGDEPVLVRAFNPTREEHGYEPLGSVVETNSDDYPFLVDSASGELEERGLQVVRLLHPIIGVERDAQGKIAGVGKARDAPHRESVMHYDLARRLDDAELAAVAAAVRDDILAVRQVVTDFTAMTERVDDMITVARGGTARYPRDEVHEVADFLEWLLKGNFVLLGAREYDFSDGAIRVVRGSGLGILHDEDRSAFCEPVPLSALPPGVAERATSGDLLLVAKTNAISPVHRHERMDYVGVRRVSRTGDIVGELRLLGLFTSKAFAERASETPLLHRKLRQALDAEDLIEGSHDYKAAVALFDSFPKEELFSAPVDDLRRAVVALTGLEGTERVRLLGRRAPDGRSVSLILSLPRSRYSAPLVAKMTKLLRKRFGTDGVEAHHVMDEGARVRVHFFVHAGTGMNEVSGRELEAEAQALARTWDDELAEELAAQPSLLRDLGRILPGPLQGLHDAAAGGDRHRLLRAAGRGGVVRRQPARARRGPADPDRALQARRQDRALARDADARGPRAARDGGDLDAPARRRRDLGAGVPGARAGRAAARPRRRRRSGGRGDRGGVPGRVRVGPAQPARHHGRARPLAGGDPARLPQVPPAHRIALHRELPERRAGGELGDHRQARALLRAAVRPRRRDRPRGRARPARRDPRRPRRRHLDRPRPHPAQPARGDRRHAAHQRLQGGPRRHRVQAAVGRRAGDPAARARVRDLRLRGRHGGDPPARRRDRPRRHPLLGPHGLPHRGLRPDAGAADQERDHRAGRRQGRLHRQALTDREGRHRGVLRHLHPVAARRDRQSRRRAGRASRGRAGARRRRHVSRGRRRQGHGDVLGHRQPRSPPSTASGSTTRSRPAARSGTTTRSSGSPRAVRGSRSGGTSASSASTSRPTSSPRSGSATCPATCSATACCCRRR